MNNVMESSEFKSLVIQRNKLVENLIENKLLKGMIDDASDKYKDPSHLVYELIQNADDACAKFIEFKLFKDKLIIIHNGTNFDFKDVESITTLRNSTKTDEKISKIGKFGVGFKSVFTITDFPEIYSGGYSFMIKNTFVPVGIENNISEDKNTIINLPFNACEKNHLESFQIIRNRLENLSAKTLLFLRNIENIKWSIFSENLELEYSGSYSKKISSFYEFNRIIVSTLNGENLDNETYIIFSENLEIEKDSKNRVLKIEIAYKIDNLGKIIDSNCNELLVFFPTNEKTNLNFILQAPFETKSSRESVDFSSKINSTILNKMAEIVVRSILELKKIGLFDLDFIINILPIENPSKKGEIYQTIYEHVKSMFLTQDNILPTSNNTFANKKEVALFNSQYLYSLLEVKELNELFKLKFTLNKKILEPKYSILYDYIKNTLNITEITIEIFINTLNNDFLSNRSDNWFIAFYNFLSKNHRSLNKELFSKNIIRLDNDTNVLPDPEHVFLPTKIKNDKFPTIKNIFVEIIECKCFFDDLKIKQPDSLAIIRKEIFPKYKEEIQNIPDSYNSDFKAIFDCYCQNSQNKFFLSQLSNLYIILSKNNITNKLYLKKPTECYFETENLKKYFNGYEVFFVNSETYKDFENFKFFSEAIGSLELPKVKESDIFLSEEKKKEIRGGKTHKNDVSIKTKSLDGLENFLSKIKNQNDSTILWDIIFALYSKDKTILSGSYEWNSGNRTNNSGNFDSEILEKLTQNKWLFNNNDKNIFKPSEIRLSQLNDDYSKENTTFTRKLNFKSEDEKTVQKEKEQSENERLKSKLAKYEELEKNGFSVDEELEKKRNEKNLTNSWKSNVLANTLKSNIKEMSLSKVTSNEKDIFLTSEKTNYKEPNNNLTQKEKDDIGYWGEEFVFSSLKKKYSENFSKFIETENSFKFINDSKSIEIIWINKNKNQQGIGRDIDLIEVENGKITHKYIEVKSTISELKDYFELTEREWDKAKKEGDNYIIYRVYNAGKNNARIECIINPYKKWIEGYLGFKSITIKC